MDVGVVLQVRMGSSRLPGKAMLPLDGDPALVHEIRRAASADPFETEDVIVATTQKRPDDVIQYVAEAAGARTFRGSESDVLGRIAGAVHAADVDAAVRISGDNPLVPPKLLTTLVNRLRDEDVEYASSKFRRTFPIGLNADAFTADAIDSAASEAESDYHREHVAHSFKAHRDWFRWTNVPAGEIFGRELMESVTDFPGLRLTMDEPADYRLLSRIYDQAPYDEVLVTSSAIRFVVENGLRSVNKDVKQEAW